MTTERIPVLAAPACRGECRPLAVVEGGVFLGLEGEDAIPPCPACLAAAAQAVGPGRLLQPLRARGVTRGAAAPSEMEAAPWDDIVDRLGYVLAECAKGSRRLLWLSGGSAPRLGQALARRVGSLLPDATIVRRVPPRETTARYLAGLLFPDELQRPVPAAPDVVLAWGIDPAAGPWSVWLQLEAWRRAGARLVVADPRASATARAADVHLPLRPGTDAALALGLAEAVRQAPGAPDLPALLASTLAIWHAGRTAEVAGVPPEALARAAEALRGARAPLLLVGGGAARHPDPATALHAITLLARLLRAKVVGPDPAPDPALAVPLPGSPPREVPSGALDAELRGRDPRRDVVFADGADPLRELAGGGELPGYLAQAGFVVAFVDHWSEIAGAADLVVPVASFLERADAQGTRWPAGLRCGRAALPVRRDALTEAALWRLVARRLGWPPGAFPGDLAELLPALAGGAPALRAGGLPGRWEPPIFRPPAEARAGRLFAVRAVPATALFAPAEPVAVLAPADAAARGIGPGAPVVVQADGTRVSARAVLDAAQPPGVVTLPEDWAGEAPGPSVLLPAQRRSEPPAGEAPGPCLVEVSRRPAR